MRKSCNALVGQEGSLMVELCGVCIILVIFMVFLCETVLYIKDTIHVQQVAREGAREASIISSSERFRDPLAIGYARSEDCLEQYFNSTEGARIRLQKVGGSIVCTVDYSHHMFFNDSWFRVINGQAVYPDFSDR